VERVAGALVAAGLLLGVAAEWSAYLPDEPGAAVGDFVVGFVFVVGGALVLRRSAATGALLAATGLAWFLGGFLGWLVFLHRGPLVHLLLSFPRGRLESRFERAVVAAAYVEAFVYPLGRSSVATLVLLAAVLVASLLRYARAGGEERRARAAALLATAGIVAVLGAAAVARLSGSGADGTWLWVYEIVLALAGAGLSADLLWGRWTRAAVTGVVVELGDLDRESTLRGRLARSVGDPSLELYYWDQARARYVDSTGEPIELAGQSSDRVVLLVGDDTGEPAAAIVHDSTVLDEPLLVEAVTAAVRIAVANADLQAQVQAKVEDVRASRRRLVEAADAEHRRLERDLQESSGPRLRLVAELLAQSAVEGAELRRELDGIREDLQELARGIHPRVLTEFGLVAALDELAGRFPFVVEVDAEDDRLPPALATVAYFVCSEGLVNAAKHAGGSRVRLQTRRLDASLVVEVADDGVGGAELAGGSGLHGLADRVEALGGHLRVESAAGTGTRLRALIPVAPEPLADETLAPGVVG
jgi:signal transduction histidine kinase